MAMSLNRFKAVLDAYGAAEARWPAEERRSALDLLERSDEARTARAAAAAFDRVLDSHAAPPSTVALQRRLQDLPAATAPRAALRLSPPRPGVLAWLAPIFARPAYPIAAALVLGLGFGIGLLSADKVAPTEERHVAHVPGDSVLQDVAAQDVVLRTVDEDSTPLDWETADNLSQDTPAIYTGLAGLGITVRNVSDAGVEVTVAAVEPGGDLADLPIE